MRFIETAEGRRQEVVPAGNGARFALTRKKLGAGAELQAATTELQESLDVFTGRVLAAGLFTRPDAAPLFLLAIHHLVVDGVSWRILLEDLETAYADARAGRAVRLPPKTLSFAAWAVELARYAGEGRLAAERPYWREVLRAPASDLPIARGSSLGPCAARDAGVVSVALPRERTSRLLQEVPRAYG